MYFDVVYLCVESKRLRVGDNGGPAAIADRNGNGRRVTSLQGTLHAILLKKRIKSNKLNQLTGTCFAAIECLIGNTFVQLSLRL